MFNLKIDYINLVSRGNCTHAKKGSLFFYLGGDPQFVIPKDVAEDKATILSLDNNVTVPCGSYSNVIKTKEFST